MDLKPGDKAPKFRLATDGGNEVSLAALKGQPFVLYFYPKDDTSGCTKEAIGFSESRKKFDALGVAVIGVSKDSAASHDRFKAKYKLNFDLLSDSDLKTIEAYGSRRMKTFLGRSFLGIIRSSYLIGPDGKIEQVWDNVKAKGHAAEVLAELSKK